MKVLAIIPARGGSKGIPRKNLRLLGGKPLLYYSIQNALKSNYIDDVYVSSEDEEILTIAKKFGAKTHKRGIDLAKDETTLDPVIYEAYEYAKMKEKKEYDLVITLQPTSPLLKVNSIDSAIEKMVANKNIDTIISAKDATHLSWRKEGEKFVPNYLKRVNRQYLTPTFVETGGFLITRKEIISPTSRIGKNVDLFVLNSPESIDIDTYEDWNLCEYYLKRKKILFVVRGNKEIGLGHVYNTIALANDILDHQIYFLALKDSSLAYEKIASNNYPVFLQKGDLLEEIAKLNPDVIINDMLDTSRAYVEVLKKRGYKVINFEDLGEGAQYADLVFNAIYPEKEEIAHHYYGPEYFLLRDEFIYSQRKEVKKEVKEILISFGGVDPNNLTKKVIESIYSYCQGQGITITVIAGFGYKKYETLKKFQNIKILKNVSNISDFMLRADVIFTSAGRTIYEVASIGTPAIVLAQNERELTHFFADERYGFIHLGLGSKVDSMQLLQVFRRLVENFSLRQKMSNQMKSVDLTKGRERVVRLVKALIEEKI